MLVVGLVYVGVPSVPLMRGDGRAALTRNVTVVVAAREIPFGQRIFPDMVKTSSIRATDVPPHTFSKPPDVWFHWAAAPIHQDEIITNDLLAAASCSWSCPPATDIVALTLPIDVHSSAGSIAAGDYVDVIATVNTTVFSPANPRIVQRTIFTGIAVIRANPLTTDNAGPPSMTVAVSACDAAYIDWLLINASLRYTVGSPNYSTEIASAGGPCAGPIGPAEVDARWGFSTAKP
jgi:Flp pilus assembly protein CpaB